ncbi:hypothetical protein H4Q26_016209 [Puccinia striiformis f. sp. tritici PST-130]|uniref:Uncharacterized protein n=1 Tax=Puccinia striiformis f. sp. tritici PST-78 TaxID=1165861 RepID=A0A0L0VZX0_9BASI|nr:hypothetical protein H4Q26_016209 [Puccinia striiformis f. sp. tritici PST-130]KNF04550.1 hypothetical protein PSTG_02459 [Puccinia striiformis f. sp. tritici PST-78]
MEFCPSCPVEEEFKSLEQTTRSFHSDKAAGREIVGDVKRLLFDLNELPEAETSSENSGSAQHDTFLSPAVSSSSTPIPVESSFITPPTHQTIPKVDLSSLRSSNHDQEDTIPAKRAAEKSSPDAKVAKRVRFKNEQGNDTGQDSPIHTRPSTTRKRKAYGGKRNSEVQGLNYSDLNPSKVTGELFDVQDWNYLQEIQGDGDSYEPGKSFQHPKAQDLFKYLNSCT